MKIKRLFETLKIRKRKVPVSLNVYFSEVYPAFKKRHQKKVNSLKYKNANFYKMNFYKSISKMP